MSLTFEFISLVIFIVVPGLLFQRFYFLGEFSKQFDTKGSVYKAIFFSVIPGVFIQLLAFSLYASLHWNAFFLDNTLEVSLELLRSSTKYSKNALNFIKNGYITFFLHQINVIVLSVFLGWICFLVVRYFKLDIKFKILRFKNQWSYIFSGELNDLKKFKQFNTTIAKDEKLNNNFKHHFTQIDVLLKDDKTLFTGSLVDYDLNYENINELDKIYLKNVFRYRDSKDGDKDRGLEITGSRTKIPVKGDVFILDAKNILNMNILYVPKLIEEKTIPKSSLKSKVFLFGSIVNISFLLFFIYSWFKPEDFDSFFRFNHQLNWFNRLLITFTIIQLVYLFLPSYIKDENNKEYKYDGENFKEAFLAFIFLLLLTALSIYYENFWLLIKSIVNYIIG